MSKQKLILQTLLLLLVAGILFLAYYGASFEQHINLAEKDVHTGVVREAGETIREKRKGIRNKKSKIFYLRLSNLDEVLGVYRSDKNYDDLVNALKVKDTVTVYFEAGSNEEYNIDVIQIEKGNQVLLDKKEHEEKQKIVSRVMLILGSVITLIAILYFMVNIRKGR